MRIVTGLRREVGRSRKARLRGDQITAKALAKNRSNSAQQRYAVLTLPPCLKLWWNPGCWLVSRNSHQNQSTLFSTVRTLDYKRKDTSASRVVAPTTAAEQKTGPTNSHNPKSSGKESLLLAACCHIFLGYVQLTCDQVIRMHSARLEGKHRQCFCETCHTSTLNLRAKPQQIQSVIFHVRWHFHLRVGL